MIKAILFDFDGVLTIDKTGSESIIKFISNKTNIPLEIIDSNYYKYNQDLLNGIITHKDMWNSFCDDIGKKLEYSILVEAFKSTRLDNNMIALVKELKLNYLIGMVTDNKIDRIETVLEFNNLKQYFDVVAISARFHSGKEKKYIFEDTIQKLNVCPEDCIFIDNTEKNLIIPKQMGMHTFWYDDENRNFIAFKKQLHHLL